MHLFSVQFLGLTKILHSWKSPAFQGWRNFRRIMLLEGKTTKT